MTDLSVDSHIHPASFRDPAGFVFSIGGTLYRQINLSYAPHYDRLMQSGLYEALIRDNLLVTHTEVPDLPGVSPHAYKVLQPRPLRRISYAAEWSPAQLKDAALLTLQVQLIAMDYGMTLKDATPYNIQFDDGKPVFLDTLSFETYDTTQPWIAYRQFCECFLFPLYIHQYSGTATDKIARAWPEGIPSATTARLLRWKSRWNPGAWMHVFLQARIGGRKNDAGGRQLGFSKTRLTRLVQHLQNLVSRLARPATGRSAWSGYYTESHLLENYLEKKEQLFRRYLQSVDFEDALDLGCNDGWFAKILAEKGKPVIAVDADWQCIDRLYRERIPGILPLTIDLANPTPASGFRNAEHDTFTVRAQSDLVTALALIHHLRLVNNIPFDLIAGYFSQLTRQWLIVEYIPLTDEKAAAIDARKQARTPEYDLPHFEAAFSRYFRLERQDPIPGTARTLYLMIKR
jgi:hypothetical protein